MVDPNDIQKLTMAGHKDNKQPSKRSMVMESAVDFRLQFTTTIKFNGRKEMQEWVCAEVEKLQFLGLVAKLDNGGNAG
jgi:hypothetical protein